MNGLLNFRDFGGGITADGRRVRSGRLFRSGHMAGLDEAVAAALLARDFAVVVDLRYADERDEQRSPWPETMLSRVLAHDGATAEDAPHLAVMRRAFGGGGSVDAAYAAFYAALPFDPWYRPLFARAVTAVARADGPVLIHCTAGKDRTGTLAAILLSALGVSDEAILADYLATNGAAGMDRLRGEVLERYADRAAGADPAVIDALLGVRPDYLAAALSAIRAVHGSVEAYLIDAGTTPADLAALRAAYLVPAD